MHIFKCTVWGVVAYVYACETISTLKIMNI